MTHCFRCHRVCGLRGQEGCTLNCRHARLAPAPPLCLPPPHTPNTAFRHLPPDSARFSYAIEGHYLVECFPDRVCTLRAVLKDLQTSTTVSAAMVTLWMAFSVLFAPRPLIRSFLFLMECSIIRSVSTFAPTPPCLLVKLPSRIRSCIRGEHVTSVFSKRSRHSTKF